MLGHFRIRPKLCVQVIGTDLQHYVDWPKRGYLSWNVFRSNAFDGSPAEAQALYVEAKWI